MWEKKTFGIRYNYGECEWQATISRQKHMMYALFLLVLLFPRETQIYKHVHLLFTFIWFVYYTVSVNSNLSKRKKTHTAEMRFCFPHHSGFDGSFCFVTFGNLVGKNPWWFVIVLWPYIHTKRIKNYLQFTRTQIDYIIAHRGHWYWFHLNNNKFVEKKINTYIQ